MAFGRSQKGSALSIPLSSSQVWGLFRCSCRRSEITSSCVCNCSVLESRIEYCYSSPKVGTGGLQLAIDLRKEEMENDRDVRTVVIGLIENRAREVGLAALDLRTASLHLSQFIETSRSYQNTFTFLQFFDPGVILLTANSAAPEGMVGLDNIVERCTDARKVPTARSCFDDTKGALILQNLATPEANALSSENYHKQYYLCLGAAAAVLSCIANLEIIRPLHRNLHQQSGKKKSLYGLLNNTKTVGGARLLRANLLQPLKTLETINVRLDCLDELTTNEELFFGLSDVIQKFPKDTDSAFCNFCISKRKIPRDSTGVATTRRSQALVAGIIVLKDALDLLPPLLEVLQQANSSLLCSIRHSLGTQSGYTRLNESIAAVISTDTLHGRSAFGARIQQCSAVKQGVDGILDVARSTFNSTSEAIHALCVKYREELELPKLKLLFSNRHGFYLSTLEEDLRRRPLPSVFVQVVKRGNSVHCSTDELTCLNSRNQEAAAECYTRTERCLEELTDNIRKEIRILSLLSESMSLLDMMVNSFATLVSTQNPNSYVRPEFSENGPLVIEAGRHPVLEGACAADFVPNNTFLADFSNLMIVTGPNMSGKSTYLRQVAQITILAHIGCYVPAQFASIRVVDHLFTRLGTGDNLELNASTFMTEMRETAFLLQYVSSRSLIVIDELGRGTTTSDGFAIAWSCCEYLLSLKAYVIFATHMHQLSELASIYPDAQSYHFTVAIARDRLDFKYVLKGGHTDIPHYGLLLAEIAGVPADVISDARKTTEEFLKKKKRSSQIIDGKDQRLKAEYQVARKLVCLQHAQQSPETLREYIKNLKEWYLQQMQ